MSTGSPLRRIAIKLGAAIGMHPEEVLERLLAAIGRQEQTKAQWQSIRRILMADKIADDTITRAEIANGAVCDGMQITAGLIDVGRIKVKGIDCRGLGIDPDTGQFIAEDGSVTLDENGLTIGSLGPHINNWPSMGVPYIAEIKHPHCEYCGNRLLEEDRKCPFCLAPRKD